MAEKQNIRTKLVTSGRRKEWTKGLVNTPVMRASTCLFSSYAELRKGVTTAFDTDALFYGRMGTPSQWSLREALADLETADGCFLYPSGVAAIASTLLALASSGDHILVPDTVYEPIRGLSRKVLDRMGIRVSYYDPLDIDALKDAFCSNTRLVLAESPGSLTFEIQDIPATARLTKEKGAFLVVDNTWATGFYFNPLDAGADVSICAGTKYLSGHSDVMIGSATARGKAWDMLERTSFSLGHTVSPDDAFLTLRGLRTLAVRLKQHEENGLIVAKWLAGHPAIDTVLHPALPSCPGHAFWQRDFSGSTGLFSIILKGGCEADTAAMLDHMTYFKMGFSWGGFESLALPADPTNIRTARKWQAAGPLIRLHIGLEDPRDLIDDLACGLDRYTDHLAGKGPQR